MSRWHISSIISHPHCTWSWRASGDLQELHAAALLLTLDRSSPSTMTLIEEPLKRAESVYERLEAWDKLREALSCHAEVARWQGDLPLAFRLARRALTLPPEPPMLWRGASILIIVTSELRAGRPEEARRLTLERLKLCEALQMPGYSMHGATYILGEIALQQGKLHQTEQSYHQLLVTAKENPVDQMAAQLGLAKVTHEWNQLAEAEQSVAQVFELGKDFVEVGFLFPAFLLQARLSQARGLADDRSAHSPADAAFTMHQEQEACFGPCSSIYARSRTFAMRGTCCWLLPA